ncbi:MAG: DUF3387 domain-containing protein, partial [Actinomycetaceae bacterium]|nr:DUF3387 domain-containing protein [Actinomycetaceae bacterium]
LRQALADYTRDVKIGVDGDDPVIDKDELIESIVDACDHMVDFLETCDFDIEEMLTARGLHLIALAKTAANAVSASDETKKHFQLTAYELLKMFKFANRKDTQLSPQWAIRDSVDAIYRQLTKKRDTADTSGVMVQLQRIIDEHIEVRAAGDESKTFDMSKINFELLHKEFDSTPNKNLLVSDIRSVIEQRLEKALADNPAKKRRDFYDRYQKIIEEYNREQDRATIEATFIKLMELSKELDEETRRYVREGFTDEKQLAVYDMLFRDDLSQAEILLIKQVAGDLVNDIQERLSHMNNWREKPETRSEIDVLIRNKLYAEMPESYSDATLEDFRNEIFNYFYELAA